MQQNGFRGHGWKYLVFGLFTIMSAVAQAGAEAKAACMRISIEGQVTAGLEWRAALGDGWIFRILPIATSQAGYSGWDLVVDREQAAGFPDALLLATMPYNSINEREIGTTFGLRAQDAIGWNPRSFRFFPDTADFREARQLFQSMMAASADRSAGAVYDSQASSRLVKLVQHASSGELRILDVGLVPGVADPAPFAQEWALAASRTAHQIEAAPGGQSSARGSLNWMKFSLTLWLPEHWRVPSELHAKRTACPI
jgi:hypothetical protein